MELNSSRINYLYNESGAGIVVKIRFLSHKICLWLIFHGIAEFSATHELI